MLSLLLPIAPSWLHSLIPIGFACILSNIADMVSDASDHLQCGLLCLPEYRSSVFKHGFPLYQIDFDMF